MYLWFSRGKNNRLGFGQSINKQELMANSANAEQLSFIFLLPWNCINDKQAPSAQISQTRRNYLNRKLMLSWLPSEKKDSPSVSDVSAVRSDDGNASFGQTRHHSTHQ